jgi:hypothetical protein
MSQPTLTLSQVLKQSLPISDEARRDVAVERALQERAVAAAALRGVEANMMCLAGILSQAKSPDPHTNSVLAQMRALVEDSSKRTVYSEAAVMLAD